MTYRWIIRGFLLAMMVLASAQAARADVVHKVKFSAEKTIILWGEDVSHARAPISAMPAAYSSPAAPLKLPVVQTGLLVPVRAGVAPLAQAPSSQASFNIVSNTAFGIRAELSAPATAMSPHLSALPFSIRLDRVGAKAAPPEADAYFAQGLFLADLSAPTTVFQSSQKTAARPGNPAEQSLRFKAEWGQPAETGPIELTFTAFVP